MEAYCRTFGMPVFRTHDDEDRAFICTPETVLGAQTSAERRRLSRYVALVFTSYV